MSRLHSMANPLPPAGNADPARRRRRRPAAVPDRVAPGAAARVRGRRDRRRRRRRRGDRARREAAPRRRRARRAHARHGRPDRGTRRSRERWPDGDRRAVLGTRPRRPARRPRRAVRPEGTAHRRGAAARRSGALVSHTDPAARHAATRSSVGLGAMLGAGVFAALAPAARVAGSGSAALARGRRPGRVLQRHVVGPAGRALPGVGRHLRVRTATARPVLGISSPAGRSWSARPRAARRWR